MNPTLEVSPTAATASSVPTPTPATKLDAANALVTLHGFIGRSQLSAIGHACYGEEQQFFINKLVELAGVVSSMPKSYETDGQSDNATVYLHYFGAGNCDWYIIEADTNEDGEGQHQAFGLADLGYGGELGYISIAELIQLNIELDLYFKPCTLAELKSQRSGIQ